MKKLMGATMIVLLALVGCSGSLPESISEVLPTLESTVGEAIATPEHAEAESHAIHWSYEEGAGSPENWVELGYEQCAGRTQSPVDLADAAMSDLENISFAYGDAAVKILNNGHTIQVDKIEGSQIVIGGETYFLKQFHFHAPSEHKLSGEQFPLEMHLVHKTADESKAAVVGVFIANGAESDAFAPVWAYLPEEESAYELDADGNKVYIPEDTGAIVSLAALLPAEQVFYRYDGSLTTPPCTPDILWSVMQTPVEMSAGQIDEFTRIMFGNSRPLQDLNARELQLDVSP